jgi:hypothetical protein
MREFEPTMMAQIDVFLVQLLRTSQQNQVAEMTSRVKYFCMDIIGQLAFGSFWKTQTEKTLRLLPKAYSVLNRRICLFIVSDLSACGWQCVNER